MKRACVVEGCGKPIAVLGLFCEPHYRRKRRWGDPLGGRTARGSVQLYLNEVVLVHDGTECLSWPFSRDEKGYGKIRYRGVPKKVSRVVCEQVRGPAPSRNHDAAHSCGKGHEGCVAPRHLSWKTKKQNAADCLLHGTDSRGEHNARAKLTQHDIASIRGMRGSMSQRCIGEMFGVGQTTISAIHRGVNWGWLDQKDAT